MVLSFSCTQNHLQIFSNARSSEAGPGTNTYVDCSSGESNRALAAVPRRSAWCALKLLGAERLTSYIHIYPGLVSFGARNVHTLLQAQPRLQNQVLRLFASSIRTKFVEKLNQKPIRSKCQKTRCRSRSSPVVKTRGRDDPKNQKGTFPTRGLEGRDITRGQYFQGAHKPPRYPYPVTHSAAGIAQPSPTSFSYTSPSQERTPAPIIRHSKARWSLRLLGNAVRGKAEQ